MRRNKGERRRRKRKRHMQAVVGGFTYPLPHTRLHADGVRRYWRPTTRLSCEQTDLRGMQSALVNGFWADLLHIHAVS